MKCFSFKCLLVEIKPIVHSQEKSLFDGLAADGARQLEHESQELFPDQVLPFRAVLRYRGDAGGVGGRRGGGRVHRSGALCDRTNWFQKMRLKCQGLICMHVIKETGQVLERKWWWRHRNHRGRVIFITASKQHRRRLTRPLRADETDVCLVLVQAVEEPAESLFVWYFFFRNWSTIWLSWLWWW